jgi:hypothetical protein
MEDHIGRNILRVRTAARMKAEGQWALDVKLITH